MKPAQLREKKELVKFKQSVTNFDDLLYLIDNATKAMGIGEKGSGTAPRAFAKDVLSIEIYGPDHPQLTLVDLPGLILSENQSQSREDVVLVSELVERYIAESMTIILPIISAKNDYANQIIIDRVRSVDKEGRRTLGIMAKPDDLHPSSESEKAFVSLTRNEEKVVTFELGWHVLKNRGFKEHDYTFAQRNRSEASFFSKGVWAEFPRDGVGIESLRTRLSELLFSYIKEELPGLQAELDKKLAETAKELQRLGAQRSTVGEQRQYLTKLTGGLWDCSGRAQGKEATGDGTIQNKRFAARLQQYGHKFKIEGHGVPSLGSDDSDEGPAVLKPIHTGIFTGGHEFAPGGSGTSSVSTRKPAALTRRQALDWVEDNLVQTRGRELAGNFDPLLIGELFWEQSENWEDIAKKHAEEISELCSNFVSELLQELCPRDIYSRLSSGHISNALKRRLEDSQVELEKIIADEKQSPMTYNHYYTMTIQNLRPKEQIRISRSVALKAFTSNVPIQIIERHLVSKLEEIFSPLTVSSWFDEEIIRLASEPTGVARQREFLEERKSVLENGSDIFKTVRAGGQAG